MSSPTPLLSRIAEALEGILQHLALIAPPPSVPCPPDKPMGREAIQFIDEEQLWELEQEEQRTTGNFPSS